MLPSIITILFDEYSSLMQVELAVCANEREALWKQVINQKYGEDDGGGAPARWVRDMVWGCGNLLGRSGIIWVVGWPIKWVMGREWDSRWTSGVEMNHFVSPSLPYLPFLRPRKLGWRMFGTLKVMGVDGPLFSQGSLMIGS